MEKKDRKALKIKLHAAFEKVLKDNRTARTDKTEKALKKLIKHIVKRTGKKKTILLNSNK